MIGGYIYRKVQSEIHKRLQDRLPPSSQQIPVWENGCIFFTNPFSSERTPYAASADLFCLSEDLLVAREGSGGYVQLDIKNDFCDRFLQHGTNAFNSVQNDFRMAVASRTGADRCLYLTSNRAGAGRIFYHRLESGIVFSSDLRFLLSIVPFDVNRQAIYAILKYGSIPEPMTISSTTSAVPAGHYLKFDLSSGRESMHPYFQFHFPADTGSPQGDDAAALNPSKEALKRSADLLSRTPTAMLLSGGIDSSLYGCYLKQAGHEPLQGFYCAFGRDDPEFPYATAIAERIGLNLQVATMGQADALGAVEDAVRLTDHPFSDFSSLPITFLLKFIKEHVNQQAMVIECNGGDDCFGFPALLDERKSRTKHLVPGILKKWIAYAFRKSSYWKWESAEGALARVASLADVHEPTPLTYFLVQAPINYLALEIPRAWDETLHDLIQKSVSNCGEDQANLSYEARTTIRQLIYINSARWAAKALSVGESLGLRVVYPYIWRDVLEEQGKLAWSSKVHNGIVKWPLKKLLEEFMPGDFIYRKKSGFVPPFVRWLSDREFNANIRQVLLRNNGFVSEIIPARVLDELLTDAVNGRRLRFPVLNMLWGAIFAESWIQEYRRKSVT
jgi:asparagine synthase (glutamine-hydrolysing)